jgi:hypothetical protein
MAEGCNSFARASFFALRRGASSPAVRAMALPAWRTKKVS